MCYGLSNVEGAEKERDMKITGFETTILKVPEDEPLANMPEAEGRFRPVVILRLRTDNGLEGIGLTFYGGAMTGSLCKAVDELAELSVGADPMRVEAVIESLRATGDSAGPGGIFSLALSAIDTALWDIKGKALQQPKNLILLILMREQNFLRAPLVRPRVYTQKTQTLLRRWL